MSVVKILDIVKYSRHVVKSQPYRERGDERETAKDCQWFQDNGHHCFTTLMFERQ